MHAGVNDIWRRCAVDHNLQRTTSTFPVAVNRAPSQMPFALFTEHAKRGGKIYE